MLYFTVIQSIPLVPVTTNRQDDAFQGFTLSLPGPVESAILMFVVFSMIALTIYILVKIPISIAKTGNVITHKAAETITPVVARAQHKKDTKSFRAKLTPRLVTAAKLLLVIVPLVVTVASGLLEKQSIDYTIAIVIGGGLASFSVIFFVIQYVLAGLLRIKSSELW